MADRLTVNYLPRDLIEETGRELDNPQDSDRLFRFMRLAERIFAAGYHAGWMAGDREARMDADRRKEQEAHRG